MKRELLCIMILIACVSKSAEAYSSKLDYVDLDEVLKNDRLVKFYYNCMMGWGKCTSEGRILKKYFPEILKTKCQKCTPLQKKRIKKVVEYIQKNKPEMWENIVKKYDPTGKLTKNMLTDPNFLGKY